MNVNTLYGSNNSVTVGQFSVFKCLPKMENEYIFLFFIFSGQRN